MELYIKTVVTMGATMLKTLLQQNPLTWWPSQSSNLSLLSSLAATILAAQPESAGIERQFSIARRILSWTRAGLSGDTVNMLTLLNQWLRYDLEPHRKAAARQECFDKKVLLSLQNEYLEKEITLADKDVQEDGDSNNNTSPIPKMDSDIQALLEEDVGDIPDDDIANEHESVTEHEALHAEQIKRAQQAEDNEQRRVVELFRNSRSGRNIQRPLRYRDDN